MPRGYIIGRVNVLDPDKFCDYAAAAGKAIKLHGAKALVRGGRCEVLEGEGRTRNVVLEFPTYEEARAYYYSKEYQAALQHRIGVAVVDVVVVEGV